MTRLVATLSLALAWLCANGAIWDAMQIFAWGKMFAGYSETMSVTAALKETLDPSKPCDLCVGVAAAKGRAEKNLPSSSSREAAKFVLAIEAAEHPVFESRTGTWRQEPPRTLCERTDPVPVRPPRA